MSINKVVIVTGSNRGIGLEIAKQAIARDEPITLFATSRSGLDLGLKATHKDSQVIYSQLDVSTLQSIKALRALIQSEHGGKVDVLINNAAIVRDLQDNSTFGVEAVKETLATNFYGIIDTIAEFAPLIPEGGRVVTISSQLSQLVKPSEELLKRLSTPLPDIQSYKAWGKDLETATANPDDTLGFARDGFFPMYANSKFLVNFLTAALPALYPSITFNAGCPGINDTDITDADQSAFIKKTPAHGARVGLQLAFEDLRGAQGKFWGGKSSADTGPVIIYDPWVGEEIKFDFVAAAA